MTHDDPVVMDPIPDLDELLWLFESEPTAAFEGDNWRGYWPYSTVRFETDVGGDRITLELEPASESARLQVSRGVHDVVDLDLRQVAHLEVERLHDTEALRVHFRRPEIETLHVQIRPAFELIWRIGTTT